MGRRSSARVGRAVWTWPDMLAANAGAMLNRMCFFGHERNLGPRADFSFKRFRGENFFSNNLRRQGKAGQDQFTPRGRSDGAVCPSVVGQQLGSIRFELRSDAHPRFPCVIPDQLSLPVVGHARLTSASGAVHRKPSRDRAGRAGSFQLPDSAANFGTTCRTRASLPKEFH